MLVSGGLVLATLLAALLVADHAGPGLSAGVAATGGAVVVLVVTALTARRRRAAISGLVGALGAVVAAVMVLQMSVAAAVLVALAGGAAVTGAVLARSRGGLVGAAGRRAWIATVLTALVVGLIGWAVQSAGEAHGDGISELQVGVAVAAVLILTTGTALLVARRRASKA